MRFEDKDLYSYGLMALAVGFGSDVELPSMTVVTQNEIIGYVVNRNNRFDKTMRGLAIANRFTAGLNGRQADTSAEDPSLFCTEERIIAGGADRCRIHSRFANLMMLALQPNHNPRALWIWLDTRPRLFLYRLPVSSIKPSMTRYVGMPLLVTTEKTVRSLFPFNDPQLEREKDRELLKADFKLYALRNDASDGPDQGGDSPVKKKK